MDKKVEDVHKNYDSVFKEALLLYKNKSLEFLGLENIAPIAEPLRTENTEVIIKSELVDLTFALKDGRGVNFEDQAYLSLDDLKRMLSYNIWLSREYDREFLTVILVKKATKIKGLITEQITFKPIIIECSSIDADAMLVKLKKDLAEGREVNELELVYLPLFGSNKYSPTELFKESTVLIKDLKVEDKQKQKLFALSIVLAGKVVDEEQIKRVWEEVINMGNVILEYAEKRGKELGMMLGMKIGEERGMKIGEERGKELGEKIGEERGKEHMAEENARRMIAKGYDQSEIAEITGVSLERLGEMV